MFSKIWLYIISFLGLIKTCSHCSCQPMNKVIYIGVPGKLCPICHTLYGLATIPAGILFNGVFIVYEGSYFRALYHLLRGTFNE